eukprot:4203561-Karenia_brevis.AAC.1
MPGMKRPPDTSLEDYMKLTNGCIKHIKAELNILDLDIAIMCNHFAWAGHISRNAAGFPRRFSGQIMHFRDRAWLQKVEG